MRFWLTVLAVLAILGLAVRLGRGPERFAASCLAANFFLCLISEIINGTPSFRRVDVPSFVIDSLTLACVTWIALRANRVWPLIISSLQLLVVFAHVSIMVYVGQTQVYWGMMGIAQYLQLIVAMLGVAFHHLREQRIGRYRSWRNGGLFPRAPRRAYT